MAHSPAAGALRIPFESEFFPPARGIASFGHLQVTWDDVLWAAMTLGRPNIHYVFRHGAASGFEVIFRWSLVRMALEQHGPSGNRLWRTAAFKSLDPTEKGAVNYFLGMTVCKLFADQLLHTPWLLHLDVFRDQLNAAASIGRSRPDLVGQEAPSGSWHAIESKGRASPPLSAEKIKAKAQAQRLISVDGNACDLHIGAITYFKNDVLHFYWRDPAPAEPRKLRPIELTLPEHPWRSYFEPIAQLVTSRAPTAPEGPAASASFRIEEADLTLDVYPKLLAYLLDADWSGARAFALRNAGEFSNAGYRHDGVRVRSGPSWRMRSEERPAS